RVGGAGRLWWVMLLKADENVSNTAARPRRPAAAVTPARVEARSSSGRGQDDGRGGRASPPGPTSSPRGAHGRPGPGSPAQPPGADVRVIGPGPRRPRPEDPNGGPWS